MQTPFKIQVLRVNVGNALNEKVRKKGQNTTTRCTMIYYTQDLD